MTLRAREEIRRKMIALFRFFYSAYKKLAKIEYNDKRCNRNSEFSRLYAVKMLLPMYVIYNYDINGIKFKAILIWSI